MEKQEIINKANEAMAEEFEIELGDITPDAIIKDTLDIDSLGLVDLVALIESLFGVKIQNTEIASIQTFQDLYDYIESKMN
ncbi:acyl carrier protein [Parabacteroides sp. PFB2-10]|uniref:acyl carrier protein n=1 Tax=unclassified Parabacteroides TaxID=2649774 RepID=UPI002476DEA0|nr:MULTISPECIES: phosphopantetheine-binding protein [unclassified Parabacteroides]MDL2208743.1 phosphopantetheine-binding protein [Parabacteroides sp. OttesenSCG-928-O15]MDL2245162.1 phosphopantetheine-binding protein [Parabacteroides sp. OttesenSCG-928-J18]MDH6313460.1 acyl carrier protein [Parabacteroides sp. PFB2-10]MDH6344111.1 acyl carrier protein [Parabacteroides sp. PM6-13]MDH6391558.1 acyl carrier protein [Parabacteroides sp. PFB2-12]